MRGEGQGGQDMRLELADIEYLVTRTISKLTRGFNSIPGTSSAPKAL